MSLVKRRKCLIHQSSFKKLTGERVIKFPTRAARCYKFKSRQTGVLVARMMPAQARSISVRTALLAVRHLTQRRVFSPMLSFGDRRSAAAQGTNAPAYRTDSCARRSSMSKRLASSSSSCNWIGNEATRSCGIAAVDPRSSPYVGCLAHQCRATPCACCQCAAWCCRSRSCGTCRDESGRGQPGHGTTRGEPCAGTRPPPSGSRRCRWLDRR